MGPDLLFLLNDEDEATGECKMQHVNFFSGRSTFEERRPIEVCLKLICLVSDNRKHIYAIGGLTLSAKESSYRVDRYDTTTDQWKLMPRLNQGRGAASACLIGDIIYVIGGVIKTDGEWNIVNSIEKYSLASNPKSRPAVQLIELD